MPSLTNQLQDKEGMIYSEWFRSYSQEEYEAIQKICANYP